MTNEITNLMQEVRVFAQQRDWEKYHNPKDLAIALVLEANEVLEPFRFSEKFNKEDLAKELADVLNVLLRLSDILEIDLIYWFHEKMKENEQKYPVQRCLGKEYKKYNEW